jgi:hypothetical protein
MKRVMRIGLAVLAMACGLASALAGSARPPLARDAVSAETLAQWIRDRQPGLVLLDARAAPASEEGLPGATALADVGLHQMPENGTVIVYGDGDVDANVLERLRQRLHAQHYLRLQGGTKAWNDEVLYPTLRSDASAAQQARFETRASLSRYFGGTPRQLDPGATAARQRSRRGC